MHLDLPDGSVELREPEQVTEAGSRGIERAALLLPPDRRAAFADAAADTKKSEKIAASFTVEDHDAMKAITDATILAFVESWTFDAPVTTEGLGELPRRDYTDLEAAIGKLADQLRPDFTPSEDPGTPT